MGIKYGHGPRPPPEDRQASKLNDLHHPGFEEVLPRTIDCTNPVMRRHLETAPGWEDWREYVSQQSEVSVMDFGATAYYAKCLDIFTGGAEKRWDELFSEPPSKMLRGDFRAIGLLGDRRQFGLSDVPSWAEICNAHAQIQNAQEHMLSILSEVAPEIYGAHKSGTWYDNKTGISVSVPEHFTSKDEMSWSYSQPFTSAVDAGVLDVAYKPVGHIPNDSLPIREEELLSGEYMIVRNLVLNSAKVLLAPLGKEFDLEKERLALASDELYLCHPNIAAYLALNLKYSKYSANQG